MSLPLSKRETLAVIAASIFLCTFALVGGTGTPPRAVFASHTHPSPPQSRSTVTPKVRAITAFVHLDRAHYHQQVAEALDFVRKTKSAYARSGYQVETLRITTQPFPEYIDGLSRQEALQFFKDYDSLAEKENFDASIGPAMSADNDDPRRAELLSEIIQSTKILEGSVIVAGDDGVHWNAARAAAKLMKFLSERTAHSQGNFRFAATALVPPGTPFYPASYHNGQGHEFAVALESANVVAEVFRAQKDPAGAQQALVATLGREAASIEAIAQQAAKDTGWNYLGLDDSPAPLKDVSIGGAIEELTGAPIGSSGTMTAVGTITGALKTIPVKRIGYSGLLLPVLEDSVLARRWSEGTLHLDALLAYSAVCGTGLDTIPLPGDITEQQLTRIIGDVASLAVKLHKPLSARLLPVAGKKPGERTEFEDPFLVNVIIQAVP